MGRSSGVLMAVSSLPSAYGVGDFGRGAYDFLDRISQMGFSMWQVLPLNPPDIYGSPYTSISAYAISELYVSAEFLQEDGLVTGGEAGSCVYDGSPYTADYDFAHKAKMKLLRCAFSRAEGLAEELSRFERENGWVRPYAVFCAVKASRGGKIWTEWPEEYRRYELLKSVPEEIEKEAKFYIFCQYILNKQWMKLRRYAAERGIKIVGDMPIYVSYDSVDVWSNPSQFMLDEETFAQTVSAGVPPDYFSEKGQLWGNPIYNWSAMKRDNFSWWRSRIFRSLELYDLVRIDHFRGLASYYTVLPDAEDAIDGVWQEGPGKALFDSLDNETVGRLIAEDLGIFGEDVQELLDYTGLPGMRVVQFGFSGDKDSIHLPHNYPKNSVAYVGTHDNSTILGWLWEAEDNERRYLLDYCGFSGDWGEGGYKSPSCRSVIETVWKSGADRVIIAFQDMCGFGNDARMNVPGVAKKSWKFRTTKETIAGIDSEYFRHINALYSR